MLHLKVNESYGSSVSHETVSKDIRADQKLHSLVYILVLVRFLTEIRS